MQQCAQSLDLVAQRLLRVGHVLLVLFNRSELLVSLADIWR